MLTENTQPAILAASIAAYRVLESEGLASNVSFVAGHSLGEYSANVVAGTLAFADAVRVVRRRGRYMQEAVPVGAGRCRPSWASTPTRSRGVPGSRAGEVVARQHQRRRTGRDCRRDSRGRACRCAAKASGKRVVPLPVSAPFHCALMPAEERPAPELRALPFDPRIPVVANVDALPKREGAAAIDALVRQVSRRCDGKLRAAPCFGGRRRLVEIGPGSVLCGLVRKIHRGAYGGCRSAGRSRISAGVGCGEHLMLNLTGKVALVTGASRGIGAAARTLGARGATVVAAARGSNAVHRRRHRAEAAKPGPSAST
jgi:[acyl-carrier-protein] S-malonyltransferase